MVYPPSECNTPIPNRPLPVGTPPGRFLVTVQGTWPSAYDTPWKPASGLAVSLLRQRMKWLMTECAESAKTGIHDLALAREFLSVMCQYLLLGAPAAARSGWLECREDLKQYIGVVERLRDWRLPR